VLVEEGITDVADLTVALLGNKNPEVSAIQESSFEDDFFSYEDKYLNEGGAQLGEAEKNITIPADLDETVTETIKDMAVDIFHLFECTGTARVDFLYDRAADTIYANEINTMPGTLYHHLWEKSGVELSDLINRLLSLAIDRHQNQQQITTTFDTDILAHANEGASQKLQNEEQ
jgi:D-alanine-D-alanine ligase